MIDHSAHLLAHTLGHGHAPAGQLGPQLGLEAGGGQHQPRPRPRHLRRHNSRTAAAAEGVEVRRSVPAQLHRHAAPGLGLAAEDEQLQLAARSCPQPGEVAAGQLAGLHEDALPRAAGGHGAVVQLGEQLRQLGGQLGEGGRHAAAAGGAEGEAEVGGDQGDQDPGHGGGQAGAGVQV